MLDISIGRRKKREGSSTKFCASKNPTLRLLARELMEMDDQNVQSDRWTQLLTLEFGITRILPRSRKVNVIRRHREVSKPVSRTGD